MRYGFSAVPSPPLNSVGTEGSSGFSVVGSSPESGVTSAHPGKVRKRPATSRSQVARHEALPWTESERVIETVVNKKRTHAKLTIISL
jgi:hypothetical protein